jgi:membrane-bound metal-dependent hydrolase YbcI (DUF457 family)
MRQAYESGEPQKVMLHTIRLGADLWRQYTVRFDPEEGEVVVRVGPTVDTGQVPLPGSGPAPPPARSEGAERAVRTRTDVGVPLVDTYDQDVQVDIFSGLSFRFERRGERLHVDFLPWHRRWSHSLTLATALGLGAAAVGALVELVTRGGPSGTPGWVGLVVALGLVGHIAEHQLGYMESNLLFPFARERTNGWGRLCSGDAIPNFLTVWRAVTVMLFNLDRFSAQPRLGPWWAFLGLALPVGVLGAVYRWRQRGERRAAEGLRQGDVVAAMDVCSVARGWLWPLGRLSEGM